MANRAEIACRIIRTLRRLGIESIAVYSDADAGAKHVRESDRALRIGESPAPASYLNPAAVVGAALEAGAEAVRGNVVARARSRSPSPHVQCRRPVDEGHRVPRCRDRRVRPDPRARVLLPRSERTLAGGASGHRGHLSRRPGGGAVAHRCRGGDVAPGHAAPERPRHGVPDLRGGPSDVPAVAGTDLSIRIGQSMGVAPVAARRRIRPGTTFRCSTTRSSGSSSSMAATE
jgi:carbamoyl-phosphate synthase L subunit-like protein